MRIPCIGVWGYNLRALLNGDFNTNGARPLYALVPGPSLRSWPH
jgi:hypothetical protein